MTKIQKPFFFGTMALAFILVCVTSPANAQSTAAPPPSAAEAAIMDQHFQQGLAAATNEQWLEAINHFRAASHPRQDWAGDTSGFGNRDSDRASRWDQFTRRPEVWFNLGLAQTHLAGWEMRAIASLQAYLLLSPNAENAPAVRAQIAQLENAFETRMLLVIDQLARGLPRDIRARCRTTGEFGMVPDACPSSVIDELASAYLYLGHSSAAADLFRRVSWNANGDGLGYINELGLAFASNDAAYDSRSANVRQEILFRRFDYLLEKRDLNGALAAERELSISSLCAARYFSDPVEPALAQRLAGQPTASLETVIALMDLGYDQLARDVTARMSVLIDAANEVLAGPEYRGYGVTSRCSSSGYWWGAWASCVSGNVGQPAPRRRN